MIGDIYVLNKNLEPIGIVDGYKSCIWSNRYYDLGDCEIYIDATIDNVRLFELGNYLVRIDDDMVCIIRKVEIDTSEEEGNYLVITGYDAKCILDQRIIWGTSTCKGNVELYVRGLVSDAIINPTAYPTYRKMLKQNGSQLLFLGDLANLPNANTEQTSYANIGEKVRDICKTFGLGYRVVLRGTSLYFEMYSGSNISDWVVFSHEYENLSDTTYIKDETNMGNVGYIAGSGEGSERAFEIIGTSKSTDRFEVYIDARDLAKKITYETLTTSYPGGTIVTSGTDYYYRLATLDIQVFNDQQLAELQTKYPSGQIKIIDGIKYYEVYNVNIALVYSTTPASQDDTVLLDVVYDTYLLSRGYEKMAEYGTKVSFDGTIIPNVTFEYKKDYNLGDIVTVENEYGISLEARITEIVEVNDENGYNIEPKFEYLSVMEET